MFCRKRITMLTVLQVSSLACKCVFYRPEHNAKELNFEDLEMQKWHEPINRALRVGEKNGVIYLFIMFTPRIMVIKMSKMVTVWAKYLSASKIS